MHYYSLEIVSNQVFIMLVFVKVIAKFLRMLQGQNFSGTNKPTRKKNPNSIFCHSNNKANNLIHWAGFLSITLFNHAK